eukprot:2755875-Amphidinium_carterae.2
MASAFLTFSSLKVLISFCLVSSCDLRPTLDGAATRGGDAVTSGKTACLSDPCLGTPSVWPLSPHPPAYQADATSHSTTERCNEMAAPLLQLASKRAKLISSRLPQL